MGIRSTTPPQPRGGARLSVSSPGCSRFTGSGSVQEGDRQRDRLLICPTGATTLHFTGPGTDATLAIERVVRNEYRRLRVTLSSNQAQEQCERTETEFHGQVTAISGTTLTVGDRTVTVTDATVIRQNDATVGLSAIAIGSFVEIDGALQADGTVLARRISIEDAHGAGGGALVGTLTV